ncbi:Methylthioadenosine phosphorylase [Candidatus Magnetoovum chiemensis]|nr:Methylthioadenosine phosphorylase [Candidatus Magnetoovum chiemensis]
MTETAAQIGIIGGSGFYEINGFEIIDEIKVDTPFGSPSDSYKVLKIAQKQVLFLNRHGSGHSIAPHKVNYRANIWGLKKLGAKRIFATGAVGAINKDFKTGEFVLIDQIIDMTHSRASTFYEQDKTIHIDLTEPYCPHLRKVLKEAADELLIKHIHEKGTYICTQGPRFETKAEIHLFASIGADVVGMTAMPEAALARELALCYATLCIVTNEAAGINKEKINALEVLEILNKSKETLNKLFAQSVRLLAEERRCRCKDALEDSEI